MANIEIESDSVMKLLSEEIAREEHSLLTNNFVNLESQKVCFGARRALEQFKNRFQDLIREEIKKMEK